MPTYGTKVPYNGHICALSGRVFKIRIKNPA